MLQQPRALSLPFLSSGRGLLPVLEHSPVLGQTARHPRPFQSLEVTQASGPGGQILLWDTEKHVASPGLLQLAPEQGSRWKGQVAHVIRRRTGSVLASPTNFIRPHCHRSDPKDMPACPCTGGRDWWPPALHWRVHAWLAACPGDKDLLGREKPCVEFFPLRR